MAYALHQAYASPTVGKLLLSLETDQEAYGSPSNELKDFLFWEILQKFYGNFYGKVTGILVKGGSPRFGSEGFSRLWGGIMTQLQPLHDSYACATRTKACSHTI